MIVYLYHFRNGRYGYERKGTFVRPRHYCGVTATSFAQRDKEHRSGRGAAFTREFSYRRGIAMKPVWKYECHSDDARRLERALKNRKSLSVFCPICNPQGNEKAFLRLLGKLNIDIPY